MIKMIDAEYPEGLDFTVPSRFMEFKHPQRTNFHPTTAPLIEECRKSKLNWVAVWCMAYVLSGTFKNSSLVMKRNYFKMDNAPGEPQVFRTWQEGIRAGVQTILCMMGIPYEEPTIWPGSKELGKKYGKMKELKDFDAEYGEGFSADVEKIYGEFMSFLKGDKDAINLPEPVVVGPIPPPPPLPVELPPEPVKETKPSEPGSKMPWQIKIVAWAAALSPLLWVAKLFLPGAIVQIIDAVQKVIEFIGHIQF